MAKVIRCRHTDYVEVSAGLWIPVVTPLPSTGCASAVPEQISCRQTGYTPEGFPILDWAWWCCDAVCTDAEELAGDCWKEAGCWPLGPGPGIRKRISFYMFDAHSCRSARGQYGELLYDAGTGKWHGSVFLRKGELLLTFACRAGDPDAPGKFRLSWQGSGCSDSGFIDQGYDCPDPLVIVFGNIDVPDCCECAADGGGSTDAPAQVSIWVAANCRKQLWGRHINNVLVGGKAIPVVARERPCAHDQVDCYSCANMTCPVVATVTSGGGPCACMDGAYPLDFATATWEYLGGWPNCGGGQPGLMPGLMRLSCIPLDNPDCSVPPERKKVRLSLVVECGADNTGSDSVDIFADELEDLDVTFTVQMADPTQGGCTGNCRYRYTEMTDTWSLISDTCSEGCDPCAETWIPGEGEPPFVPEDGSVYDVPCEGDPGGPDCCEGTITVRVMR